MEKTELNSAAKNQQKLMLDLKLAPSKYGTCEMLLRLES